MSPTDATNSPISAHPTSVKLVVFDWAGTTCDHGSRAPLAAFIKAFSGHGVELTVAEARESMGKDKRDHIRAILSTQSAVDVWASKHGRTWNEEDVEMIFTDFSAALTEVLTQYSPLIADLLPCLDALRAKGILIGSTTGYPREIVDILAPYAAGLGYVPDAVVCADDVAEGRPAPWMLYRAMAETGVYPPAAVVKVGDTPVDIEAGRNGATWAVGIAATGNEVGLTEDELAELPADERERLLAAAREHLRDAGAHYVIDRLNELPRTIDDIERRLAAGEKP